MALLTWQEFDRVDEPELSQLHAALIPTVPSQGIHFRFNSETSKLKVGIMDWSGITLGDVQTIVTNAAAKTARTEAKKAWDQVNVVDKAFAQVLLDEINILRSQHALPDRTMGQLSTAIKNKLDVM